MNAARDYDEVDEDGESLLLPSVVSRMSGLDRYKNSATRSTNFVVCDQLAFDRRARVGRVRNTRDEFDRTISRRRPQQLDRVFRGDRARRRVYVQPVHQVPRRGPVAMAVEQRADDAAVQHAFISFVFRTRLPLGNNLFAVCKAANMQALGISGTTTKAREIRREDFLNTLVHNAELRTVSVMREQFLNRHKEQGSLRSQ